jgi:hypothetical protein
MGITICEAKRALRRGNVVIDPRPFNPTVYYLFRDIQEGRTHAQLAGFLKGCYIAREIERR